jgi:WD40 repeat protein
MNPMIFQRRFHISHWLWVVLLMGLSATYYAQEDTGTTNARWSPDARWIAGNDAQGILQIWDGLSGDLIKQFEVYDEGVSEISWSPDGTQIAVATTQDFMVRIWEVETGKLVQTLQGFPSPEEGMSLGWQPNGDLLAAVAFGEREQLVLWQDTAQGFQKLESENFASLAYDLQWSPDGQQLAFADFAGVHIITDFANLPLKSRGFYGKPTVEFAWSPDSTNIVGRLINDYITLESSILVVDVQTGTELMTLPEDEDFLGDLSWNLDSDQITTRGEDGTYHVWDLASKQIVDSFTLDQEIAPFVTASPYGGRFAIPPSTDDAPLEIVVLFESMERVQGIARRCLTDTDNPSPVVTSVLNHVVSNALTKLTLPAFVQSVKALPVDAIPAACSADLVAVAEAVIAGQ